VVVIGGSAGGLEALTGLVPRLPRDLPAAILAVLHFPATGVSRLAAILARSAGMAVTVPWDGEPLQEGHIYVPPGDHHMLVGRGRVRLNRAPRENGHRPAIDPLFRSAARFYGGDAVGVVLCGNLDDGSSGLLAIRRAGGVGVVLDPEDCAFADMPRNAIAVADPEHVVRLDEMGSLITELIARPVRAGRPRVVTGRVEAQSAEEDELMADREETTWGDDRPGRPSGFSCPECHGVLWEVEQPGLPRFVCRIGHRISAETLLDERGEEIENALWAAVRALEEQSSLAQRLCDRAVEMGNSLSEDRFRERADNARRQAEVLRAAALRTADADPVEAGG
jgi:two-component system, chemotaxis family, protein-glutamate methylesterase/glutaminase